ncbi:uncharacterized protein LOC141519398 [Macrotis lagotis]|uniref:uncharacterized protein LOC141519398 n=1 Tax=Macrotis lagotis TaxID=92651 RepID=UPI003D69F3BD
MSPLPPLTNTAPEVTQVPAPRPLASLLGPGSDVQGRSSTGGGRGGTGAGSGWGWSGGFARREGSWDALRRCHGDARKPRPRGNGRFRSPGAGPGSALEPRPCLSPQGPRMGPPLSPCPLPPLPPKGGGLDPYPAAEGSVRMRSQPGLAAPLPPSSGEQETPEAQNPGPKRRGDTPDQLGEGPARAGATGFSDSPKATQPGPGGMAATGPAGGTSHPWQR